MKFTDLIITVPKERTELSGRGILDLRRYLYVGGAGHEPAKAHKLIEKGDLGEPQWDRFKFLAEICNAISAKVVMGEADASIIGYLTKLRIFLKHLDNNNLTYELGDLLRNYIDFSEYLFITSKLPKAPFTIRTAYDYAATLSTLFGTILNIDRSFPLIQRTRLHKKAASKKALSKNAEKQNLEKTFNQGRFLVDLIAGLTIENIQGKLPLLIKVRSELIPEGHILLSAGLGSKQSSNTTHNLLRRQRSRQPTHKLTGQGSAKRWGFINLRVQAEMFVFLAQTGMNLTQAKDLRSDSFKYKLAGEGWLVRGYKKRKGGEVRFEIYESYKPYFEGYRKFVRHFFPDTQYLFPQFALNGKEESLNRNGLRNFKFLKDISNLYKIPWVTAGKIRQSRVNWYLRRSGDEDLTAEVAQHTKMVLKQSYELPSQQRAMVEITQFWNEFDPISNSELTASVLGSWCDGKPTKSLDRPSLAIEPNCVNPSGCLWCRNFRDLDSQDYVWSIASMRKLKVIEASKFLSESEVPSDIVINRLSEKLKWFGSSSKERAEWVLEATKRIEEGYFHPSWSPYIKVAARR